MQDQESLRYSLIVGLDVALKGFALKALSGDEKSSRFYT